MDTLVHTGVQARTRVDARALVKTAGIAAAFLALAVIGRVAMAGVPNVQPVTALCVLTGIVCGRRYGLLVGAAAAILSNMFLGQGAWTICQMAGWGLAGWGAGVLFCRNDRSGQGNGSAQAAFARPLAICAYGFAASLAFGAILDTQVVLLFGGSMPLEGIMAIYAAGLPFNLLHAAGTLAFLVPICGAAAWRAHRVAIRAQNSGKVK